MKAPAVGRYLLILVLFALCTLAMTGWLYDRANRQAAAGQLATTQEYFRGVIAGLEQRWGREAFNLKARLESIRFLENPDQKGRLLAYLNAQGGSIEFPSLRVEDIRGEVLFAHQSVAHKVPKAHFVPNQDSAWAYEPTEERLFLVYRQPIWLGEENGYLYLFKPMDHALLSSHSFPGTYLSLWWNGKAVASSEGTDGLADEAGKPVRSLGEVKLPWGGADYGSVPTLKVEILPREVFSALDVALPLLLGLLVFAAGTSLILASTSGACGRGRDNGSSPGPGD